MVEAEPRNAIGMAEMGRALCGDAKENALERCFDVTPCMVDVREASVWHHSYRL